EVFADSKSFGRLSLGQGSLATDGLTEIDLSGTGVVSRASAVADGGGLGFVVAGAETPLDVDGDAVPDVRVNRVFRNLSGGRDDRVRYDTPTFHGFQLSSSYIDGGKWDLAIGYAGELADLKVAARIGYTNQSGTNAFPEEIIGGSLSVLHASGLNAGIALGRGDDEDTGRAQGLWFGKLGYQTKLLAAGTSAFALDYGRYDDFLAGGDEAATFGVQVVQRVSDWGTDFYAGYRNYRLDRPGTSFNSIDTVLSGARVRS
ncbi:MAG: porin, partial [Alphaproteobacteria bacterium]|nr:porin [Alphaproteobacteria bacterium]